MADSDTQLFQNVPEYSVAELAHTIKRTLEQGFSHIRLRGEISGYRGPHSSGHSYFSLKDEKAKIDAVIWRGVFNKLKFKPEEGLEVIATGKVSSYPGSSKYQIIIEAIEPAGVGALMALLEERKKKLAAEGLFDEEKKKPIPFLPRVIGIITSPTGAVIRDMMHGFTERFPAHVIVWPVRVQGETCGVEVTRAIQGFNALSAQGGALQRPDLLIVARGGGSLEDLWGFNEENVARAVAASTIPVISAVGHETDWTIIDLVADSRAPTPTKAAEWAVPKYSELLDRLSELELRLTRVTRRILTDRRTYLTGLVRALPRSLDLVALPRQRLDLVSNRLAPSLKIQAQNCRRRLSDYGMKLAPALRAGLHIHQTSFLTFQSRLSPALQAFIQAKRLVFQSLSSRVNPQNVQHRIIQGRQVYEILQQKASKSLVYKISNYKEKLAGYSKLLSSLSYQSVLKRGFALVRDENARMIRGVGSLDIGQSIDIEFADGHLHAKAEQVALKAKKADTKLKTHPTKKTAERKSAGMKKNISDQGSLF